MDPHQQSVYRWEESWPGWNHNQLTLKACRRVIEAACKHYQVVVPTVVQHAGGNYAWSMPTHDRISMQGGEHFARGSRNVPTALHEAAHHIGWHLYRDRIQDHGRTFVRIYLDLLTRAKVAPRTALEATLREHGLKWK